MIVFVLGTVGSGKTTFSVNFKKYLEDACLINLDPGNDLNCDVSIRDFVKTEDVMKKFKIGPNYAIIKSIELVKEKIDILLEKTPDTYWKVVDTPGQLELFLYKDVGRQIINSFKQLEDEIALIFLVDIYDALTPQNFVTILAWEVIISLKLELKCLTVINKIDLASREIIESLIKNIKEKRILKELESKDNFSYIIAKSFSEFYEYSTVWKRPLLISAKNFIGFESVEKAILEMFCSCGDIT